MRASFLIPAAFLAVLPASALAQSAFIATCDVGPPGQGQQGPATRVFRVAPGSLQEWQAEHKAFGPNLCLSFSCTGERGKLEGRIESASLIFTLALDPAAKTAAWRTVGASGLARTSGTCEVKPEPPPRVAAEGKK